MEDTECVFLKKDLLGRYKTRASCWSWRKLVHNLNMPKFLPFISACSIGQVYNFKSCGLAACWSS